MRFEGRRLGRYQLHRLIGRGGAGEVYLADDQRIPRQVAVKTIQSDNLSTEDAKDTARLFLREARAVAILNHPHILPLFDFGEENLDGIAISYLVTPFCPEGSLPTWLHQRHRPAILSPQELIPLIQQAADALAYAHEHGIVHRDVKPSNFLVRTHKVTPEQPDLLLADFVIARFTMNTAHISQMVRGTPIYMSPEQWKGHSGNATDQYSLAVMAYELLTGQQPFRGTAQQVMYQHSTIPPQPPSTINSQLTPAIDKIMLQALAKEPDARFPSIADFARAFTQTVQEKNRQLFSLSSPVEARYKDAPHTPSPPFIQSSVHTRLQISITEASRGGQYSLSLPKGQIVKVTIPPGVYDGQEVYLENFVEPSTPGDQKRNLIIQIAVSTDIEEKTLFPVTDPQPSPQNLSLPISFWSRLWRGMPKQRSCIASSIQFGLLPWFVKTSQKIWVMISPQKMKRLVTTQAPQATLSLFAVASVALEKGDRALVKKHYSLQAGISQLKPEDFAAEQFRGHAEITSQDSPIEPIWFDILFHESDNVKVIGDWQQRLHYNPHNPGLQFVSFTFQPLAPGKSYLVINFYRERRWLKTIQLEFTTD